uniref:Uncharacterized protein n=1 Tax=Glossina palpalis gambiensis TaxID=67801 RepID=A0A1B0BLJ6_9MUSC
MEEICSVIKDEINIKEALVIVYDQGSNTQPNYRLRLSVSIAYAFIGFVGWGGITLPSSSGKNAIYTINIAADTEGFIVADQPMIELELRGHVSCNSGSDQVEDDFVLILARKALSTLRFEKKQNNGCTIKLHPEGNGIRY